MRAKPPAPFSFIPCMYGAKVTLTPTECSITFLEAVQSLIPHWIPSQGDNVVYAIIEEALSDSIGDVELYLSKVFAGGKMRYMFSD